MIFMPPRHGKSRLASIEFPAWFLGRNSDKEIITASYSAELAQDFGGKTRDLVRSTEYQTLFNTELREDSKSKAKWVTKKKGSYTAVGVGGAITGRGANVFLIDDPLKNREEADSETIRNKIWGWFTSTAYTRLEKDAAVILIMTRWHLDDLAGRLLEKAKEEGQEWEILDLPAIAERDEKYRKKGEPLWPEKYDKEALADIRATVGAMDWLSLYQQKPIAAEFQEFKKHYFRYYEEEDLKDKELVYMTTVDPAIGKGEHADYTAIVTVGKEKHSPNWYIVDIIRERLDPMQVIEYIFKLYNTYRQRAIGIETVAYQKALLYFLQEEMKHRGVYLPIVELKAKQQKEVRVRGLVPMYKTGVIFHRVNAMIELEEELLMFPKGTHDDMIDALAYQLQLQEHTYQARTDGMTRSEKILKRRIKNARGRAVI